MCQLALAVEYSDFSRKQTLSANTQFFLTPSLIEKR
jgi:hypothetical protein